MKGEKKTQHSSFCKEEHEGSESPESPKVTQHGAKSQGEIHTFNSQPCSLPLSLAVWFSILFSLQTNSNNCPIQVKQNENIKM